MIPDLSDLIGRPFDEQTWNCWTLCREVYLRRGIMLPDYGWSDEQFRGCLAAAEIASGRYRHLLQAEPWCIAAIHRGGFVTHTGIVLPDLTRMIHVCEKRGTIIEPLRRWQRLLEGYFDYGRKDE